MSIEIEYFTGLQAVTGLFYLKHSPSTGANGQFDVAVDPLDGPAQIIGKDFGVTNAGLTGVLTFNLPNSDILDVTMNRGHGVTGPLDLRVLYNY
jgi:hypothetical protein